MTKKAKKNKAVKAEKTAKVVDSKKLKKIEKKVAKKENRKAAKADRPKGLAKISMPKYSLGEELVNSISHGFGAALAICGLVLLILKADRASEIVGVSLYGAFMIMLYIMSCLYHALSPKVKGKKVLRVIDHANVFLMEAGTFMPICLGLIRGTRYEAWGWFCFGIVWAITAVAVVFSSINVDKYQGIGLASNLILGWGSMLMLPIFVNLIPAAGIMLLVMGGVAYSLGAILYGLGSKMKWMHSVFHFYVLLGSIFHFFFIYLFCL